MSGGECVEGGIGTIKSPLNSSPSGSNVEDLQT